MKRSYAWAGVGSDTSQGPERLRARLEVQITHEDGRKFYMKRETSVPISSCDMATFMA